MSNQQWDARHYHEHSKPQEEAALQALSSLNLQGNEHVLDIGCGEGRITAEIAKKVPNGFVVGIDLSHEMIEYASNNFSNIKNLTFQQLNAEDLTFEEEFDYVVSFSSFHWIKQQQKVLASIAKSLKPSGKFLLTMSGNDEKHPMLLAIFGVASSKKWQQHIRIDDLQWYALQPDNLKHMLEQGGLTPMQVAVVSKIIRFKDKQEFVAWLVGWIGGVTAYAQLSKDMQDSFLDDVVEQYLTFVPLNEKGIIECEFPILTAMAEKSVL